MSHLFRWAQAYLHWFWHLYFYFETGFRAQPGLRLTVLLPPHPECWVISSRHYGFEILNTSPLWNFSIYVNLQIIFNTYVCNCMCEYITHTKIPSILMDSTLLLLSKLLTYMLILDFFTSLDCIIFVFVKPFMW